MTGADGASSAVFDPQVDYSPFRLYAALRRGAPPVVIDLRGKDGRPTLRSARPARGGTVPEAEGNRLVVLVDEDGEQARRTALALRARGRTEVRALYGGLALWRLCFQESVVAETFLTEDRSR